MVGHHSPYNPCKSSSPCLLVPNPSTQDEAPDVATVVRLQSALCAPLSGGAKAVVEAWEVRARREPPTLALLLPLSTFC